MERIDTLVIGGGQAGLAMSRSLSDRGIEHVVLERGRTGERWRSERWYSLRLLTPRWLSRLSGWSDDERDPHGFMAADELVGYLERFARAFSVPMRQGVTVTRVRRADGGFLVDTDHGAWSAARVVIATGQSQRAHVPAFAGALPAAVEQAVPTSYRDPSALPDGAVLVVGASATGIQLADEIHRSGRPVTLAVGRHTRLPRRYRGRDILAWLHDMGILDQPAGSVGNLSASLEQPSMQLVGGPDPRALDLGVLVRRGVRLVGRATGAHGRRLHFADDLIENMAASDLKLAGLRARIDRHVHRQGLNGHVPEPDEFEPVPLPRSPGTLDLGRERIRTVVWATGFRRDYPWLEVPVLDAAGDVHHRLGVTEVPGLYVIGLNFLRRRSSSFLAGVGHDADDLAEHILASRRRRGRRARRGGGRAVA